MNCALHSQSAGGATEVSPARKRWDPIEKQYQRRRCGTFLFASNTASPNQRPPPTPRVVILSPSDEDGRRISKQISPPNRCLDDPCTQFVLEKKKGGEPGLLASLLFPFRGI